MLENANNEIDRRTFVKQAGGTMLAAGMSAKSYARVLGANDRIRLGQLGCGDRSEGHVHMVALASKQMPVETVAVCDIWKLAREHRAAQVKKSFNLEPQSFKYSEEMLAMKDLDGVMIATGDFQHAKLCAEVVKAGKDCYVEKPFANVLSEAIETRDIVKQSKQIVQVGTQHRSQPYPLAVRDIIRSGRIGEIVHIEQEWNVNEERWRFTPMDTGYNKEMLVDANMEWKQWLYGRTSQLREQDTDWKRWLLGKTGAPIRSSCVPGVQVGGVIKTSRRESSISGSATVATLCICGAMRDLSGKRGGQRRNLRLERRTRKSRYMRRSYRVSEGFSLHL